MNSLVHPGGEDCATNVVPGRLVRVSEEAARVGAPASCAEPGSPRVELIRDGELVKAIDVICGCGQRIRLRCVYDQGAP
jgi:hypothetical protein